MLANEMRPQTLDDVVGQTHLIGEGKLLNELVKRSTYPNMIFFGPPGTGKTTVAQILAESSNLPFEKINATTSSLADVKEILKKSKGQKILLYIDEIQNFNKRQQQSLLDYMEKGDITLIASTTENPYHAVYKSVTSRSLILEFKSLSKEDLKDLTVKTLRRIKCRKLFYKEFLDDLASYAQGDGRSLINILQTILTVYEDKDKILKEDFLNLNIYGNYVTDDTEEHYNLLSAFQKSIRGSDTDAALYYLARLIKSKDLISIKRRLLVIAAEDISLANPMAFIHTKAIVDAVDVIGLPEAEILLSQAVVYLCISPKSNACYEAVKKALYVVDTQNYQIPDHLKDAHYEGAASLGRGNYLYPFCYPYNYVKQTYLPEMIKDISLYTPQAGVELKMEKIMNDIKAKSEQVNE